jgi:K+-transporting ATPase ATPase B chain
MTWVRGWAWEHSWGVFSLLGMLVFNWVLAAASVPHLLDAYRAAPAADLLRRNLLIYGVGGIFAPFVGIKLIDLLITAIHLA